QARIDLAAIERLGVRRGAAAAFAQFVPEREPFADILVVVAQLAFRRVQRLAALTEPDFEAWLYPATVLDAGKALAFGGLGDLHGKVADLFPCHLPVRHLQAETLDQRPVVNDRGGVEAETDPIDLAINLAAIDRGLAEILQVEGSGNIAVERQQRSAARIFEDVAIIHLQ